MSDEIEVACDSYQIDNYNVGYSKGIRGYEYGSRDQFGKYPIYMTDCLRVQNQVSGHYIDMEFRQDTKQLISTYLHDQHEEVLSFKLMHQCDGSMYLGQHDINNYNNWHAMNYDQNGQLIDDIYYPAKSEDEKEYYDFVDEQALMRAYKTAISTSSGFPVETKQEILSYLDANIAMLQIDTGEAAAVAPQNKNDMN